MPTAEGWSERYEESRRSDGAIDDEGSAVRGNEADLSVVGEKSSDQQPAISVHNIAKRFGHIEALRGVSLEVMPGEILAIVGDNGAGKSTLIKTICGALSPDSGVVRISGRTIERDSIRVAAQLGVGVVYQDLALALDLRVYENIYLGHDLRRKGLLGHLGLLDRQAMATDSEKSLASITNNAPSVYAEAGLLSGGQRQMVAVARAVKWSSSAVILDEPTAALGVQQTERVNEIILQTAAKGIAVLLVSHDMPDVLKIAHRIVVMRHGAIAADLSAKTNQIKISDIVTIMLGGAASPAISALEGQVEA
jgi:simple sugar transport system ATP-binding protein